MDHDGVHIPPQPGFPLPAGHASTTAPRRVLFAWGLWDWGQQTFNTVMLTFVFSVYITTGVAADEATGTAALSGAQTWAGVIIALVCPLMGVLADRYGRRRRLLGISTLGLVLAMASLFWAEPDPSYLTFAVIMLAVASVISEIATVFYNGMLLQIATPSTFGRVSGMGWGLGYLGGLVALVACLFLFVLGRDSPAIQPVALLSAAWTAVFCLPLLIMGPNTAPAAGTEKFSVVGAYRDILRRIVDLWRHQRSLLHFFVASAIFRDGLGAVFAFAGIIAAGSFFFSEEEVIYLGIAANLVAGISTWALGRADDRLGPRVVIVAGLAVLVVTCTAVFLTTSQAAFWVCAVVISVCVGPVQSASRSMLARMTPPGRENENFGLYATTGRAVSFLAPFAFTVAIAVGDTQKAGILGIVVVLVLGLAAFLPLRAQHEDATR
ncbi:MFS transporter [Litorihabitans aurantiacus]|uniref:MFS transporter n=1 Tax=Litorihabitans aurantiacus TaxID=1930061 RepID=A0AA37XGR7_9MICO|nr:MFS transporter [Litorihabitans aurantiacus]GMA32542.1 MFS transporter [Litorihabitans aurantiacus]